MGCRQLWELNSGRDLTAGTQNRSSGEWLQMRGEFRTVISTSLKGSPRLAAKPTDTISALWGKRQRGLHIHFPPFICSRPPLVVGHPQLNLHNRALGTGRKTVQAPQPSISILFSLPTAAHSGLPQPVLTSSAQTEQRRIWEKLVILVTPRNTPFTCDMTNISAIRISRSLIILDALTYIPNHYLI